MKIEVFDELKAKLSRAGYLPLYYQIERELEKMLKDGVFLPGEKLPGDLLLSKALQVNYRTIRKALLRLSQKKLVSRIKNVGTFVSEDINDGAPTLGFFYPAEAEIVMSKRAEFIQRYCTNHSFDLKIISYDTQGYFEGVDLYREMRQKNLVGAIIVPVNTPDCMRSLLYLEEKNFPYVRFARSFFIGELKAPVVRGNDEKRTACVLHYLWNLGHRKIGLVCAHSGNESEKEYRTFYQERDFEGRWLMNLEFSGTPDQWKKFPHTHIARGYLGANPDISALLIDGGIVAVDFLRQAFTLGKTVPGQLSLVSLGDWEGLDATSPPIAAMHLSNKGMAEKAADILLEIMRNGLPEKEQLIKIDYQLIERGSVAPPNTVPELVEAGRR